MRVLNRIEDFRHALDRERAAGRSVGLVPTMGFLHEGHLSLVRRSVSECDVTAVTVFVNPLQFGPREDLATYPSDLEGDVLAAGAVGADVLFAPPVEEMYPEPLVTTVTPGALAARLEGASRPGHMAGVATVVAKLFNAAGPCRAYFGEKDYQQLLVVERMVRDLSIPVEVIRGPTVREPDGLAQSSRNVHLHGREREAAAALYRALRRGAALIADGQSDPAVVRRAMAELIDAEPAARTDYAAVVDADDLGPLEHIEGDVRLLVAARVGHTRLIDNIGVRAPARFPDPAPSSRASSKEYV